QRAVEHLRTLAIFHYVLAGMTFLVASLFIVYLVTGALTMAQLTADQRSHLPQGFGAHLQWVGIAGIAAGWSLAALNAISAWMMQLRKARGLSLFVAALNLAWAPAGTCLGLVTMWVLSRESVRSLYGK
ncbi:MAG TPA: hypothetical protein VH370_04655, partial [Humisphaera sp.]|nr:hypothetical protein [Humisphaera sp.]